MIFVTTKKLGRQIFLLLVFVTVFESGIRDPGSGMDKNQYPPQQFFKIVKRKFEVKKFKFYWDQSKRENIQLLKTWNSVSVIGYLSYSVPDP